MLFKVKETYSMHFGNPTNINWEYDGYFFAGNTLRFGGIN